MPMAADGLLACQNRTLPVARESWSALRAAGLATMLMLPALSGCRMLGGSRTDSQALLASRELTQQGQTALDRQDLKQAESLLARAVQLSPSDAAARRHYAEALWQRGAQAEALIQADEAVRQSGGQPDLLIRAAQMRLDAGQFDAARIKAEEALAVDNQLAAAWAIRGHALRAAGDLRGALHDYQRALARESRQQEVLYQMADCYLELGDSSAALVALQALEGTYAPGEEPQSMYLALGRAYADLGRYEEALANLDSASQRGPVNPELLYERGHCELLVGRYEPAAQSLQEALTLEPNHAASRELLDDLLVARQNGLARQNGGDSSHR